MRTTAVMGAGGSRLQTKCGQSALMVERQLLFKADIGHFRMQGQARFGNRRSTPLIGRISACWGDQLTLPTRRGRPTSQFRCPKPDVCVSWRPGEPDHGASASMGEVTPVRRPVSEHFGSSDAGLHSWRLSNARSHASPRSHGGIAVRCDSRARPLTSRSPCCAFEAVGHDRHLSRVPRRS